MYRELSVQVRIFSLFLACVKTTLNTVKVWNTASFWYCYLNSGIILTPVLKVSRYLLLAT